MANINSRDTSAAHLEFKNGILTIKIKEGAEVNMLTLKEQFEARIELVGDNTYGVLIMGDKSFYTSREARKYMAQYEQPNRVGTAILTESLVMLLFANFYLTVDKPKTPAQLFNKKEKGEEWLRELITLNHKKRSLEI